jgi:hypothetical protein
VRAFAIGVLLLVAGCPPPVSATPDLATPPDLAQVCGGSCAADQYCQTPCNNVIYCYAPVGDGGCQRGDTVRSCFSDMALGCTFDDRPRCVSASADCQRTGSCESCSALIGCACP